MNYKIIQSSCIHESRGKKRILVDPRIRQDPGGSIRIQQDPIGSNRIQQDPLGSIRIYQDPLGSIRIHQDPLGSIRCIRMYNDLPSFINMSSVQNNYTSKIYPSASYYKQEYHIPITLVVSRKQICTSPSSELETGYPMKVLKGSQSIANGSNNKFSSSII